MIDYSIAIRSSKPGTKSSDITETKVYGAAQISEILTLNDSAEHIEPQGREEYWEGGNRTTRRTQIPPGEQDYRSFSTIESIKNYGIYCIYGGLWSTGERALASVDSSKSDYSENSECKLLFGMTGKKKMSEDEKNSKKFVKKDRFVYLCY